jgi:hypothetical protein
MVLRALWQEDIAVAGPGEVILQFILDHAVPWRRRQALCGCPPTSSASPWSGVRRPGVLKVQRSFNALP